MMKEFKETVEKDSRLYMLFNAMFDQVRIIPFASLLGSSLHSDPERQKIPHRSLWRV